MRRKQPDAAALGAAEPTLQRWLPVPGRSGRASCWRQRAGRYRLSGAPQIVKRMVPLASVSCSSISVSPGATACRNFTDATRQHRGSRRPRARWPGSSHRAAPLPGGPVRPGSARRKPDDSWRSAARGAVMTRHRRRFTRMLMQRRAIAALRAAACPCCCAAAAPRKAAAAAGRPGRSAAAVPR